MREKYRAWSDWPQQDFVAKAGQQHFPLVLAERNEYQIRYKMAYTGR